MVSGGESRSMEDELALLITVVLAAEADQPARDACGQLARRIDGRIVQSGDCSDEEPGCWSVSISRLNGTRTARTDTRALADAVRGFVHQLGPGFARQRVACDPPAAWTVVDDPELVGQLVPGGERMLVEAWAGAEDFPIEAGPMADPVAASDVAEPADAPPHLQLWVDVLTDRSAGAEWQARAVASRVTRAAEITEVINHHNGLITVGLDLGPALGSPAQVVLDAMSGIGRPGWTPLEWEGESAVTRWVAMPRPEAGIAALELTAGPPSTDLED